MKIFDLDGTLIDSNNVWLQVDLDFLGRHNLTPTREYCDTVGHSIFPIAAQFTKDYYRLDMDVQTIMDEWLALARDAYARYIPLKEGVPEYLRLCRAKGEPMAVLTACVPELCRAVMERHGLQPYFSQIIYVQEMGLEKNSPEVFLRAARMLGTAPEHCTVYEDSPAACAAAKAAGMDVVGVFDSFYSHAARQLEQTCRRCISSFRQLLP